ncbi:hypothetical protein D3C87_1826860 [compost metagenome]
MTSSIAFCALSVVLTLKFRISVVFFARFRFSLALDFIGGKAKCPRRFQHAFQPKIKGSKDDYEILSVIQGQHGAGFESRYYRVHCTFDRHSGIGGGAGRH